MGYRLNRPYGPRYLPRAHSPPLRSTLLYLLQLILGPGTPAGAQKVIPILFGSGPLGAAGSS